MSEPDMSPDLVTAVVVGRHMAALADELRGYSADAVHNLVAQLVAEGEHAFNVGQHGGRDDSAGKAYAKGIRRAIELIEDRL